MMASVRVLAIAIRAVGFLCANYSFAIVTHNVCLYDIRVLLGTGYCVFAVIYFIVVRSEGTAR